MKGSTTPKAEKDYYLLAEKRGFKWVGGNLPKNTKDPTQWECKKCRYVWESRYNYIQQNHGCHFCAGKVIKTEKDYNYLAKFRGFEWTGGVLPKTTNHLTCWKCGKCKYTWDARYQDIQRGSGCPVCSGKVKKIKEDYYGLAKSRGFKWVSKKLPKNVVTGTWWKCGKGHRWKAQYSNIQHGSGCPICKDIINGSPVSKPQRKLNNLLCGSLNYPEGRYRVDVAIMRKSQKIAIEYDAQYWHDGREAYDAERDSFLIFRGWKIIHVKSGNLLPTRKQLNIVINSLVETNNCIYNLYLEDWKI